MTEIAARELIAQLVLSWRASGHFLPYDDYAVIDKWLESTKDPQVLIHALTEALPDLYAGKVKAGHPPPLRVIERRIAKKIGITRPPIAKGS